MKKKLILVASPPACGKTYVSRLIAKAVEHAVYLDKDDLCDLLRAAFQAAGQPVDMDGLFYGEKLRPAEYATVLNIAFSALEFEDLVILNAPFGKEVRDAQYMRELKERANAMGAELLLIWITVPMELWRRRMEERGSGRDTGKLERWEDYVKTVNHEPPYRLREQKAVDGFLIFNNACDTAAAQSLEEALKMISRY